jgi:hypothetical protein
MLVTWNIDLSLYSTDQLEELYTVISNMDYSIAKQIDEEIENRKI